MLGLGLGIPRMSRIAVAIGDTYQGGIVFHLGSEYGGQGLIAASTDNGYAPWGCYGTALTGANGDSIGTGAQNTIDILAECTTANTPADRCRDYSGGGYTDWFLPSKDELKEIYDALHVTGLSPFANNAGYWASSQNGDDHAQVLLVYSSGFEASASKLSNYYSRAIRAF